MDRAEGREGSLWLGALTALTTANPSGKSQSFTLGFGQSSVTSAPPPGSPPGRAHRPAQAPCCGLPAPTADATLWPQTKRAPAAAATGQARWLSRSWSSQEPALSWAALNAICIAIGEPGPQCGPFSFDRTASQLPIDRAPVPAPDIMQMPARSEAASPRGHCALNPSGSPPAPSRPLFPGCAEPPRYLPQPPARAAPPRSTR